MSTMQAKRQEGVKRLRFLASMGMELKEPIKLFTYGNVGIFENQGKYARAVFYNLMLNKGSEDYDQIIEAKNEFEKEYNCLVYLIQITHTEFGKLVSMLYVSDNSKEWESDFKDLKDKTPYANVYNQTYEESEIGRIGIEYDRMYGGIYRTA